MADLPQGVTDPLDPAFQTDDLWTSDAQNAEKQGNVFVPIGALPDDRSHDEPTAEAENAKRIAIRHFADYVQGLAPVTALDVAGWLGLPTYATGSLPAASAPNEGRVYFDTTTNRIVYDNGGALVSVASTTDVAGAAGVHVFAEGGSIDGDYDGLVIDEDTFAVTDNFDGTASITVGEIEFANLPDGSAQSVLGRSANSTGVLANIAGTGTADAPTLLSSAGTVAFRSISTLGTALSTFLDQDLTALSTNAFTDGTEVVGALSFTVVNTAAAGANWGVVNGTGLRMSAASGIFNSTTQSGPYFYITLANLAAAGYQPGRILYLDLAISNGTFTGGNDRFVAGLWGPAGAPQSTSTSRTRVGFRGNNGGATQTIGSQVNAAAVNANPDAVTPSALFIRLDPAEGLVTTGHGTYSGGAFSVPDYTVASQSFTNGIDQMLSTSVRLVFALNFNTACAIDISRWRLRQG